MKTTRAMLCAIAVLAVALPLYAQEWWHTDELVENDHVYSMDYVTPHVQWAKPLPGGPIRALFFVRAKGTGAREIAEMAQRLQIEPRIVYYEDDGALVAGGEPGLQRALRLIREGADVFVFANVRFGVLTHEAQYYVLEHVIREGAGLAVFHSMPEMPLTDDRVIGELPAELTSWFPVASLPMGRVIAGALNLQEPTDAQLANRMITRYRLGEGRAVRVSYRPGTIALTPRLDFSFEALDEYEYWAGFAANVLRWAAGRDAAVAFVDRPEGPVALHRDDLPRQLSVAVTSDLQGTTPLTIATGLKRSDGGRIAIDETALRCAQGETVRALPEFPRLPAGDHVMEVVVSSPRGVEAFGAQTISVTTTRGVESVALDEDFVEAGGRISGSVAMRGQDFPPGERLELRLRDAEDRVVALTETAAQAGQVPFSLDVPADDYTILMRAEAALVDAEGEVDRASAQFTVPRRNRGQFNFIMWAVPDRTLGYWAMRSMREAGVTGYLQGSSPPPTSVAALDMTWVPYTTRILETIGEDKVMQPVCWNNEPEVTEHIQQLADKYYPCRKHGVYVYSLGDENHTRGACAHPECIDAWREWLRGQYENIAALNESWGTDFASFDAIELFREGDINEQAALNAGQFARWYDRQAFKRFNYAQYCGRYARAYAAMDPLAITGFEGAGSFGDAYDAIIERVGFWGPYPSIGDDIIRSAAPPDLVNSNWMGYSKTGDALADAAWRMVMKDKNSIWYWMWSGIGSYIGYVRPTLDLWPATEDLTEEMRPVRRGLGDLLMRSDVTHSGIGILYSLPSALASGLGESGDFIAAKATHEIWTQLTYELGLDLRYITDAMLAKGVLDTDEFSVLLLPMTQALSAQQAELIRGFVEDGGTVIADVRPAVYDDHCKPVMPGLLDELFGITRTGRGSARETALALDGTLDGRQLRLDLPRVRVDTEVTTAGGQAAGSVDGTPVLVSKTIGNGRAVLLNFQLTSSSYLEPGTADARRLLQSLYEVAGARGAIEVASPRGEPLPRTETRVWSNGDALVFGLWRQMENAWFNPKSGTLAGEPVAARVQLPSEMHVYDLRAGRYLGTADRLNTRLQWGRANFFMALPYEIPQPAVTLEPRDPEPGGVVTASIRMDLPDTAGERFAVWVEVIDPEGESPLWGQRVAVLEGGEAQVRVQVAHNDLPGTWRVRATELFSGQSAEAGWEVQ